MSKAIWFGRALQNEFSRKSHCAGFGELAQFRALQESFGSLSPKFEVEEYHGAKRQVYFNTTKSWLRSRARCELCDLLLIAYSTTGRPQVRLLLLQAKLSRRNHSDLCSLPGLHTRPTEFKGNFEQWDLLSARPSIYPTGVFTPPSDLLRKAIVPSIGAFGVFHRTASGAIDMFYASADTLRPVGSPSKKDGKLSTTVVPVVRRFGEFIDKPVCCCLQKFGESIFSLQLGTPIVSTNATGAQICHEPLASFVKDVLTALMRDTDAKSQLAPELMGLIGDPVGRITMDESIPSLVILKGNLNEDEA